MGLLIVRGFNLPGAPVATRSREASARAMATSDTEGERSLSCAHCRHRQRRFCLGGSLFVLTPPSAGRCAMGAACSRGAAEPSGSEAPLAWVLRADEEAGVHAADLARDWPLVVDAAKLCSLASMSEKDVKVRWQKCDAMQPLRDVARAGCSSAHACPLADAALRTPASLAARESGELRA